MLTKNRQRQFYLLQNLLICAFQQRAFSPSLLLIDNACIQHIFNRNEQYFWIFFQASLWACLKSPWLSFQKLPNVHSSPRHPNSTNSKSQPINACVSIRKSKAKYPLNQLQRKSLSIWQPYRKINDYSRLGSRLSDAISDEGTMRNVDLSCVSGEQVWWLGERDGRNEILAELVLAMFRRKSHWLYR